MQPRPQLLHAVVDELLPHGKAVPGRGGWNVWSDIARLDSVEMPQEQAMLHGRDSMCDMWTRRHEVT
jgi:hypothetical protein